VSDGLSYSRDPAPADNVPHAGEPPAAQPLTDILLRPAARPSRPPEAPRAPVRAPVEVTIDGVAVAVSAGSMTLSPPNGSQAWTTGQTDTDTDSDTGSVDRSHQVIGVLGVGIQFALEVLHDR